MPSSAVPPPDLDSALRSKSNKIIELQHLRKTNASVKKIRALAEEIALVESWIVRELKRCGQWKRAQVNRISQASCLELASRPAEALRIYRSISGDNVNQKLSQWLSQRIRAIGMQGYDPDAFQRIHAHIDGNQNIRVPQLGAYHALKDYHAKKREVPAIVQMPVGCGKSGVMAIAPFGVAQGRTLVVAPNLEIRGNLRDTLDFTHVKSFWKRANVLSSGAWPTVAVIDGAASASDCDSANFVVANIQQLVSHRSWLGRFGADYFDMVLVDEAHHAPAKSWQETLMRFPDAKVSSFTATPLRADGAPVEGERVYRFPIAAAIKMGYVKDLAARRLEPEVLRFTIRGANHLLTLKEVLELRETAWFSKGVALSRECNEHIADASIQSMEQLRREGTVKHQIIAAACSIDHAKAIRSIYEERNYAAEVVHSSMQEEERKKVMNRLRSGAIDAIVQVAVLGEGADYPNLSVAAIFRPYRHLVPYMQFIGRTMRALKPEQPGHVDNRAFVVTHAGLNVDRWWDELSSLDEDDRQVVEELGRGARTFEASGDVGPRQYRPTAQVLEETLRGLVQSHYLGKPLSPIDKAAVVEDLLHMVRLKGFDPETLGVTSERVMQQLEVAAAKDEKVIPFVERGVQPQEARKQARRRLDERIRSAAREVISRLQVQVTGRELMYAFPGVGQHNLGVAIVVLNQIVNERLGIERDDRASCTLEQLREAHDSIDSAVDAAVARIMEKLGGTRG